MKKIQPLRMKGTKPIEDMIEEEAKLLALLIDTEGSISAEKGGAYGIVHPVIVVSMRS